MDQKTARFGKKAGMTVLITTGFLRFYFAAQDRIENSWIAKGFKTGEAHTSCNNIIKSTKY